MPIDELLRRSPTKPRTCPRRSRWASSGSALASMSLLFLLAACGGGASTSSSSTTGRTATASSHASLVLVPTPAEREQVVSYQHQLDRAGLSFVVRRTTSYECWVPGTVPGRLHWDTGAVIGEFPHPVSRCTRAPSWTSRPAEGRRPEGLASPPTGSGGRWVVQAPASGRTWP